MRCNRARDIDLAAFSAEREDSRFAEFREHYPLCPDCAPEVGRWLRLEAALRAERQPLEGPHPKEAQLLAYAREPATLETSARTRLTAHLEDCAPCRSEVAVLGAFDFSALDAPPTEPARAPLGVRLREALGGLAETLFGAIPQPLLVPLALALLLVPVGLLIWGSGPGPGEQAAQLAEQPVDVQQEPGVASDTLEVAVEEPPPRREDARDVLQLAEGSQAGEVGRVEGEVAEVTPAPSTPTRVVADAAAPPRDAALPTAASGLVPLEIAAGLSDLPIRYGIGEIPLLGGPNVRVGGTARAPQGSAIRLQALGPEHVGWTSVPTPTLYWWLSEPSEQPVEISLSDERSVAPLFEATLPGPHPAGLHVLPLAAEGVRLAPGEVYRWQAALVVDPRRRAADLRSAVALRFQAPDAETAAVLTSAPSPERAHRYAESGYWYDAFALLSQAAAKAPGTPDLRAARAALLLQVGFDEGVGEDFR